MSYQQRAILFGVRFLERLQNEMEEEEVPAVEKAQPVERQRVLGNLGSESSVGLRSSENENNSPPCQC